MADIPIRFRLRRGTAAALAALNEIPLAGELVVATDTGKPKLGDGATAYNALPFWTGGNVASFNTRSGAVVLTYADVTGALAITPINAAGAVTAVAAAGTGLIKSSGTALSAAAAGTDYVAPGAFTASALTMSTARLLGRTAAATGAAEEISIGSGLSFSAGVLAAAATGTVTSVAVSGGTTGLTVTGSPITTSGTVTLGGTLAIANGGTGAATAAAARTALGLAAVAATGAYSDLTGRPGALSAFTNDTSFTTLGLVAAAATGLIKSSGTALSAAAAGTDYVVSLVGGFGVMAVNASGIVTVSAGSITNAYAGDSGEYMLNVTNSSSLATVATAASRFEFYPLIPLAQDMTISALAIYVTTGVATALSRVGIYADNAGKPDGGARLGDSGALDCATTATAREGAVSLTLTKGTRYWLCILSNNAQTLRALATSATMALPMVTDLSGTSARNVRRATLAYAALPATAPATINSTSSHVAIGLKYA